MTLAAHVRYQRAAWQATLVASFAHGPRPRGRPNRTAMQAYAALERLQAVEKLAQNSVDRLSRREYKGGRCRVAA